MWVCRILKRERKERGSHTKRKERVAKRELLSEKEDSQERERESYAWRRKKKGEYKVLLPLREIISVCVRVKKNKRDFSLAVRHTQELL